MTLLERLEAAPLSVEGVEAWTSVRAAGSFGLGTSEPVNEVYGRWKQLKDELRSRGVERLACGSQVHRSDIALHGDGWKGFLRVRDYDGHATLVRGTALAVTVADCTPVFLAHPAGAVSVLHAGWRGTAAGILGKGVELFRANGFPAEELSCHLGPSICGKCYEVGPEVLEAVTGSPAAEKGYLDVRAVLRDQANRCGVKLVTTSKWCTRCHNDHFFSHRAGDEGRLLAVIALGPAT